MPNNVRGYVEEANTITGKLKVRPENDSAVPVIIDRSEVKIIKDSVIKVNKDEIRALKSLEEWF